MVNQRKTIQKSIAIVVMLILTVLWMKLPILATTPAVSYVIDTANILTATEKIAIEERLASNNEHATELIAVFLNGQSLPTPEQLNQMALTLTQEKGYGIYKGEDYGSLFLFVNKSPAGEVTVAVVPTSRESYNYTSYQTAHMVQELEWYYSFLPFFEDIVEHFIKLSDVYMYPVLDEVRDEMMVFDIKGVSDEIVAWREAYDQNIVLLINDTLTEEMYSLYMENYFISQGYGSGDQQSGVFVLISPNLGSFNIQFYGTASKDYGQTELDGLVAEISAALENDYSLIDAVYAIEKFLDPEANIPLVQTSSEGEKGYVVFEDNQELLSEKEWLSIDLMGHRLLLEGINIYGITHTTEAMTAEEMAETAERLYLENYAGPGILTCFDALNGRHGIYKSEDTDALWQNHVEILNPVEAYLAKQLEKEAYSPRSIFKYQYGLTEMLVYLSARYSMTPNIIEEVHLSYDMSVQERFGKMEEEGLTPLVLTRPVSAYDDAAEWLEDYKALMQAAGVADNMVALFYSEDLDEIAVSYFGKNKEIAEMVETQVRTEMEGHFASDGINGLAEEFLAQLEEKVMPLVKTSATDQASTDSSKAQTEEAKASSGNGTLILIIVAVVVVLIILIIVIAVSGKKKKNQLSGGNQGGAYYPGYSQTSGTYGNYGGAANTGYGGYPAANNANATGSSGYSQTAPTANAPYGSTIGDTGAGASGYAGYTTGGYTGYSGAESPTDSANATGYSNGYSQAAPADNASYGSTMSDTGASASGYTGYSGGYTSYSGAESPTDSANATGYSNGYSQAAPTANAPYGSTMSDTGASASGYTGYSGGYTGYSGAESPTDNANVTGYSNGYSQAAPTANAPYGSTMSDTGAGVSGYAGYTTGGYTGYSGAESPTDSANATGYSNGYSQAAPTANAPYGSTMSDTGASASGYAGYTGGYTGYSGAESPTDSANATGYSSSYSQAAPADNATMGGDTGAGASGYTGYSGGYTSYSGADSPADNANATGYSSGYSQAAPTANASYGSTISDTGAGVSGYAGYTGGYTGYSGAESSTDSANATGYSSDWENSYGTDGQEQPKE